MKPKKRQKMCCHCEGEVDVDVIVCPYCAADLREEKPELQKPAYSPSISLKNLNTQQSLYPPHYAPKEPPEQTFASEEVQAIVEEEPPQGVAGPIVLMTLGAQLFLFGLCLLLFSHKGSLLLKWDARLWFVYILSSIPLLIFGYRSVVRL